MNCSDRGSRTRGLPSVWEEGSSARQTYPS